MGVVLGTVGPLAMMSRGLPITSERMSASSCRETYVDKQNGIHDSEICLVVLCLCVSHIFYCEHTFVGYAAAASLPPFMREMDFRKLFIS